jgi:hypothetical protein
MSKRVRREPLVGGDGDPGLVDGGGEGATDVAVRLRFAPTGGDREERDALKRRILSQHPHLVSELRGEDIGEPRA